MTARIATHSFNDDANLVFAPPGQLQIRVVAGEDDMVAAMELRSIVFRDEQGLADIPMTDPDDRRSQTILALLDGTAIATGRLTPPGPQKLAYLSWIATSRRYRRQGIGTAVVRWLVESADRAGYPQTLLSAQAHAIDFYRKFGFQPIGNIFSVRGIHHQAMSRVRPQRTAE